MDIKVLEIRLIPYAHKTTRAYCDVQIGSIVIRDFRVYQTNGKPHVKNPFNTYRDQDRNLIFREIVSLPLEVKGEVDALILAAYFRRLKEEGDGKKSSVSDLRF
jgi:hypothetical protein